MQPSVLLKKKVCAERQDIWRKSTEPTSSARGGASRVIAGDAKKAELRGNLSMAYCAHVMGTRSAPESPWDGNSRHFATNL